MTMSGQKIPKLDDVRDNGRGYANKRFYQKDFSGQNLANSDFRGAHLVECIFDGADLTSANLTDANCYGATFRGTRMYRTNLTRTILANTIMEPADLFGATVTLTCDTFEGMQLSDKYLSMWIFLATIMNIDEGLRMKLEEIIGKDRVEFFRKVQKRDF